MPRVPTRTLINLKARSLNSWTSQFLETLVQEPRVMSSPTDTIDISIGAQLSRVAEGFPATVLIRVLLHHFAVHNVVQFIRNAQSWNQIYYKSRLVYDSIQKLVEQLDDADGSAEVITLWKTFQLYTAAIIPLEKWVVWVFIFHPGLSL